MQYRECPWDALQESRHRPQSDPRGKKLPLRTDDMARKLRQPVSMGLEGPTWVAIDGRIEKRKR